MSSGGGGNSTTTTQQVPEWLSGAAQGFLQQAGGVSQLPYENYNGPRVANLSPMTRDAMGGYYGMMGGTPYTGAAGDMLTETLRGGGMNPYMDGVADRITADATRAYNDATGSVTARFNRPGNFAGSAHQDAQQRTNESFARGLGDALAPVYQGGYENERGRQMQAAGLSSGLYDSQLRGLQGGAQLGDMDRMNQQALFDSQYGDWREFRDWPEHQLGVFGNALGAVTGAAPRNSTTTGPGPDRLSQGFGTLMLGNMLQRSK